MKAKKLLIATLAVASVISTTVFASEVPTYEATKLAKQEINVSGEEYTLEFGMEYTAVDSVEAAKASAYADWYADFEVTFSEDVSADDLALVGYYANWCDNYNDGNWLALPVGEINAGEAIKAMETLIASDTKVDTEGEVGITYAEVVEYVGSFKCGVVFKDMQTAKKYDGMTVSVSLNLYNPESSDVKAVGETATFTVVGAKLPAYSTSTLTKQEINLAGAAYTLEFGMQYDAVDTVAQAKASAYADWYADFEVTFSEDVDVNDLALVGYYADYCKDGSWVALPVAEIKAGTPIKAMETLGEGAITYADVIEYVNSFKCGIVLAEGAADTYKDMTVSVTLKLYDPESSAVEAVGEAAIFTVGKTLWITKTDAGFYLNEDTKDGLVRFLFYADVEDVTDYGVKCYTTNEANAKQVTANGNANYFYADVTNIPEDHADTTFYAAAYVTVNGEPIWSDVVSCTPNFDKQFAE